MSLLGRLLGRQRARWDESWQTYPGTVADAPALWTVDLGAVDAAPVAAMPFRLDIIVPYPADSAGLPSGHLADAEAAVRTEVDSLGGVYLGRIASRARCRFTAHLPAEPSGPITVAEPPGVEVLVAYDPHWAYVRDSLAPDERQARLLADRAVLDALAEQGDRLATARPLAHVAFFAEPALAEDAAVALRADGFIADVEPDGEGDYALTAVRSDPVAPPGVHELTWSVQEIVERYGGTYDGWTCAVEP